MSGFSIPGLPSPDLAEAAALRAKVQEHIDRSVAEFESKFSGFGMLTIARSSGWIVEYRKELVSLARLCLRLEFEGAADAAGGPQ